MANKVCQRKLKILPKAKWTLSKWPKFFNTTPKWQNFAKFRQSAHHGKDHEKSRLLQ